MKALRFLALAFFAAVCANAQSDLVRVSSPGGQIEFRMFNAHQADPNEPLRLAYQVSFHGKLLIDTSYLGLEIRDQPILGVNYGLLASKNESVDETYTLPAGKAKTVRNHYNSLFAQYLGNGTLGRFLNIEVRAYDDGVAFRYLVPRSIPLDEMLVENDATEFNFAQDAETYGMIVRNFQTPYEDQYNRRTLSGIHPESLIALPFLVEQPGAGWVAVTEADIDNFAGMYLQHLEGRRMIGTLSPRVDEPALSVRVKTPAVTPWRVLLIGSEPGRLIESNIVTSLNPPSQVPDTSWIKPGKAAGNGWSGDPVSSASIKNYIDFAAESKLEYVMIDAGWSPRDDLTKPEPVIDMPEVLRYARSKKIGIWLWAHWSTIDRQMEQAFALFQQWGVAGVKVDGMDRDDQWMVDFYRRVAKSAAAHHLMLDFHGAFKPDGISRTWPNVLTREAVLGQEYSKWSARITPDHDVMLAFTRLVAGPMDYTPGGFNNVSRGMFLPRSDKPTVMGTRAHQLALYVVFESPLNMVSDSPDAYKGQREFDFLKSVPAAWDETRAVNGRVGEYVTIARRSGTNWYLGAITNWDSRDFDVPLDFLGSGDWTAEIYSDAPDSGLNPKHTLVEQKLVNSSARLKLALAAGGGAAVRFERAK